MSSLTSDTSTARLPTPCGELGCFDPALNQIVINRVLDRRDVPEYVVSYVLYHEMLHQKHPVKFGRCRRESHSLQFRREERQFSDYARAMKFLSHFGAGPRPRITRMHSTATPEAPSSF
jgi:hypothetical protein